MGRLTVLKQIAADLASQFGPDCEVVIHDLKTAEPEHSIVYIMNGHVTNRDVGDGCIQRCFRCDPQPGKRRRTGRPYRIPDENRRRKDSEMQHFLYSG